MYIRISKNTFIRCYVISMMILQSDSLQTMGDLVKELEQMGYIHSEGVATAMYAVDRKDFLNTSVYNNDRIIYDDINLIIGYGATITAPSRQAEILELMADLLQGDNKTVLDIGSGSGYITVCMATMLGNEGLVIGIDHIPELVQLATNNTMKHHSHLIKSGKLKFNVSDGRNGYMENGPYDIIHVGAAVRKVPYNILEQLKPGGRYVGPIGSFEEESGQFLTVINKGMEEQLQVVQASKVFFRYLQDKNSQILGTNMFEIKKEPKEKEQNQENSIVHRYPIPHDN